MKLVFLHALTLPSSFRIIGLDCGQAKLSLTKNKIYLLTPP